MRRGVEAWSILFLLLLPLAGCQTVPPLPLVWHTVSPSLRVPVNVERLAVLYPRASDREVLDAYERLAGVTFELKELRPSLHIVERFDLPAIQIEQLFQLSGAVSDETVVGLGHLLGADGILLYHIEGPTLRDRVLAHMYGSLPPVIITSKIIRVESAEVIYHNVVTAPVEQDPDSIFLFHDPQTDTPLRASLERGVGQTIADLRYAFR